MKMRYINKHLTGDILLYPMKGFYLLTAPSNQCDDNYHTAFMGDKEVALLGNQLLLMVQINHQVASILHHQMTIKKEEGTTPFLCISTHGDIESASLSDVSFARYEAIDQLKNYVTKKQWDVIQKKREELNHA
jgi:hypothetical protein